MGLKEFAVRKGIIIYPDGTCLRPVGEILGTGAPGGDSGIQDAAGLGMNYVDTATGDKDCKTSITGNDASDWTIQGADPGSNTAGVTTATNVDCVDVDVVKAAEWEVSVEDQDNPDSSMKFKVFAGHNGTAAADATAVDHNRFSDLCFGTTLDVPGAVDVDVVLTGTGAAQQMCLQITSNLTNGVDVVTRRADIK